MSSQEARRLTEAHRLAQARLGADTVRLLVAAFHLLNPDRLDATFERWLATVAPLVQAQRLRSSRLAATYLNAFRTYELGSTFPPVVADAADEEGLRTSMFVTGPVALRARLGRGMELRTALDLTVAGAAGAAMRWALNGGRETILNTINADPKAVGYERVTSGNACEFCSMLADRGAVYGEESADFEAHDHCACGAEVVYG